MYISVTSAEERAVRCEGRETLCALAYDAITEFAVITLYGVSSEAHRKCHVRINCV